MLAAGADVNARTDVMTGAPLLSVAASEGQRSMVGTLLEFGADVSRTGRFL